MPKFGDKKITFHSGQLENLLVLGVPILKHIKVICESLFQEGLLSRMAIAPEVEKNISFKSSYSC